MSNRARSPRLDLPNWLTAHPSVAALLLGLLSASAYPPLSLWPLGLVGIAGLIALLRRARGARQATLIGWLFGWAHLSLANSWIATAFTFQSEMPAWLGWAAVPLLCIYLAVYPSFAALGAHLLARRAGNFAFGAAFASCWIVTEWLRSWVFTGYPWPPLGLMLLGGFDSPGIAAALPWLGTYALSGLAILIGAGLAAAVGARRWFALAGASAALAALMIWPAPVGKEGTIRFALIQPNISQEERNDPAKFEAQFARIAALTRPGNDQQRLVLWPESAVPDYLRDGYPDALYFGSTAGSDPAFARRRIGDVIGKDSLVLLGAVDLKIADKPDFAQVSGAYNVITAVDGQGRIRGGYAKAHLVPYGEYLPMRSVLEPLGLSRLVAGSIDFIPGPGPQTIDLGAFGRAGLQICYEIVFSGRVVDRKNRPDYIFNPSNDSWFGAWGPPQHLAQARMRAIEEGLPILRSTTNGISAVIDAHGVVRDHIARGVAGRIDGMVPPASAPTLFARLGNILPLLWAGLLALGSLVAKRRRSV